MYQTDSFLVLNVRAHVQPSDSARSRAPVLQLLWKLCLMTLRIARILFLSAWLYGAEEEDAALTLTCPPSRAICSLVRIIWYGDDMLVDSGGLVVYYAF